MEKSITNILSLTETTPKSDDQLKQVSLQELGTLTKSIHYTSDGFSLYHTEKYSIVGIPNDFSSYTPKLYTFTSKYFAQYIMKAKDNDFTFLIKDKHQASVFSVLNDEIMNFLSFEDNFGNFQVILSTLALFINDCILNDIVPFEISSKNIFVDVEYGVISKCVISDFSICQKEVLEEKTEIKVDFVPWRLSFLSVIYEIFEKSHPKNLTQEILLNHMSIWSTQLDTVIRLCFDEFPSFAQISEIINEWDPRSFHMRIEPDLNYVAEENERFAIYRVGNQVFASLLNQSNLGYSNNKFYVLQIIESVIDDVVQIKLFTKWGRVGQNGQNACVKCQNAAEAILLFQKKFKEKTGNDWNDRDNFKPVIGKYLMMQIE